MTYGIAAPLYLEQGWNTPIPLPYMQKYPPPDDVTGNFPEVPADEIERWIDQNDEDNIGLRMPRFKGKDGTALEVIGFDVDHYDDKMGGDTMRALVKKLGPLPYTWRSTSRGIENEGGIFFFVVPAGQKWAGKAGHGIEIIQHTHRYSVAWPSIIPDKATGLIREYTWYRTREDGVEERDEIPSVHDIPMLPTAWQVHFQKGVAQERSRTDGERDPELRGMKEVREWMAANLPGYSELPSSEMARVSDLETLKEEAAGGAHDMLVARSHQIIMLAVEGHHGAQAGLEAVQNAFLDEVLGKKTGKSRRSAESARAEIGRALGQEIEKLKYDIENELVAISTSGFTAEDEDVDTSVLLEQFMERRRLVVDAEDFDDHDIDRGRMFLEALGDAIRPVQGTTDWAWWNGVRGRLEVLQQNQLTKLWMRTVMASLSAAAEKLSNLATAQEENGLEEDAKKTTKRANDMLRRARAAGNRNQRLSSLSEAHTLSDNPIRTEEFDRNVLTLGVANGVLDFADTEEPLRVGTIDDMILENTQVNYRAGAKHPLFENYLDTFLPDLEYRRFVQRVFGYGMLGRNPERLMVFLQGPSATGKSTLISAVEAALGGYAATVQANGLFRERQDAGPAPELLTAMPKRLVFSSEVGNHNRLHADVIKRLTGGDSVTARALYSNEMVTRVPMFTAFIATNSMPTIADGDDALWRRILVLPFDRQVQSGRHVVMERIDETPDALEAVLAWLVDGLLDYLRNGLHPRDWPEISVRRSRMFISGTSDFQGFLSDTVEPCKGKMVDATKLFQLYQAWSQAEGIPERDMLTRNKFGRSMTANGYEKKTTSRRIEGKKNPVTLVMYVGLRMKTRGTADA